MVLNFYQGRKRAFSRPVRRATIAWQTGVTCLSPHLIARCGMIWSFGDLAWRSTSKNGVASGSLLKRYCVYRWRWVVFGAFSRMYPAVTNVPLVLFELDIEIEMCWAAKVAFVVGSCWHLTGLSVNPYLSPNTIWDFDGRNVIVGGRKSQISTGVIVWISFEWARSSLSHL